MFFDSEIINTKTKNDIDHPHRHPFFELFLLEGNGNHLIDFKQQSFGEHTLHIICPKQVHLLKREIETKGFVLKFDELYLLQHKELHCFYEQIKFNIEFNPIQNITKHQYNIGVYLFDELKEKSLLKHQAAVSYLTSLFKLENHHQTSESTFTEFLSILEKNYKQSKKVVFYTELLSITEKQLNDVVKRRTGESAKQFISNRLLLEAKRMLFHGELSVKEIAYELNFNEPAHFSNFFKKELGVSPQEFKNEKASTM